MPISRKDFEMGNFAKKKHKRTEHPILIFLKENEGKAYTVKEICKGTKTNEDSARGMLRVLVNEGYLVHTQPYFIFKKAKIRPKAKSKKK